MTTTHSPGGAGDGYETLSEEQMEALISDCYDSRYLSIGPLPNRVKDKLDFAYLRGQQVERAKWPAICPEHNEPMDRCDKCDWTLYGLDPW